MSKAEVIVAGPDQKTGVPQILQKNFGLAQTVEAGENRRQSR